MAKINSLYGIDLRDLDLNRLFTYWYDDGFEDNTYTTYNNVIYQDTYWVDWYYQGVDYRSVFGGLDFTFDTEGNLVGGTVTGYVEGYWDTNLNYITGLEIEEIAIEGTEIWNAALTSTLADDHRLLQKMLSGNDQISGSNYSDVLLGYSGNDEFYATAGNDQIIGGSGIDTYINSSISSNNLTITQTLQGYSISSALGTDELIGVEQLQLQDGVFALSDLTTSSETIYVLILDNFGYTSASNDHVIFLDYEFSFIDGVEDYFLDSLAADELLQLPYQSGFGMDRVADENGAAYFSHYFDHTGTEVYNQDYLAGDYIDNDPLWDYFLYQWDESIGAERRFFLNDIDGLDTIAWIQEGLDLGMYLLPYDSFTDLDGSTDFYDETGTDPYNKIDIDPTLDYVFLNWEENSQPDFDTGELRYLTKSEIESLHLSGAGDFSDTRFHGDIVLDNFYSELDPSLADQVVVIAVDVSDNHYETQDDVWIYQQIGDGTIDIETELQTAAGISLSDISVISLSIGSTAPESDLLEQTAALGPTIVWALPNGNKWGNRFWDAYLEEDIANTSSTLMVSGFDGMLPAGASEYADIFFDTFDSALTGEYGTSFATPKAAAELVNFEAELLSQGSSLSSLPTQTLINYLNTASAFNSFGIQFNGELISGTINHDSLSGSDAGDFLLGFEGDDLLSGGSGDDYFFASFGIDTFEGGSGSDTLIADLYQKFEPRSQEVNFNTLTGFYQSETISSIENFIIFGDFNLSAIGGSEQNIFLADAGDDYLDGGAGNDRLDGGAGSDEISDGYGNDTVFGGAGDDILYNIGGSDQFDGGEGNDTLITDLSTDYAARSIYARIDAERGITGQLWSNAGQDSVTDIENFELIGDFNTVVIGSDLDNQITTDMGDDRIAGGLGADSITSGSGSDLIIWRSVEEFGDTLTDFSTTDTLDISLAVGPYLNEGYVKSDIIRVTQVSSDTIIEVDINGSFSLVATLSNSNAADLTLDQIVTEYADWSGQAYHWANHSLFADAIVDTLFLEQELAITENETGRVVSAADALAALKLAVGINPNTNGYDASPYQYIAADVNQDGRVSAADALSILKMAVNLSSAPEREWVLVREETDFYDETRDSYTVNRSHVDWQQIYNNAASLNSESNLVAVLKGDVNGSWEGSSSDPLLDAGYFTGLEVAGIGPTEQWWV